VLIGFPSETREESEETLKFLLTHRGLIDTPFSVTPLSKFELLRDAPMQRNLAAFGVQPLHPLRGPLDYQQAYSVSSGMGPDQAEAQYHRFVDVISKEFRAHSRMPENKSHSLLFKSLYADAGIEREVFSDEIHPGDLARSEFTMAESVSLEDMGDGTWAIQDHASSGSLRIGGRLALLVREIQASGRLATPSEIGGTEAEQIARFLTYLRRNGYLATFPSRLTESAALLRV
jgi:hypothetical protein